MTLQPRDRVSTLATYSEGRDNNLNLLRILAASLVIVTHTFGISGHEGSEPLKATFDISFGSWAVDIFFVVSGFLIAKSWDRSRSPSKFLWARIMRIYPALWVCVLICVFAIGIAFTTLPAREYLLHADTWKFVAKNLTLLKGTFTSLPGTFVGQGDGAIDMALWTLPYELKMYLALLLLGWTGWLYKRGVLLTLVVLAFSVHAWCFVTGFADTRLTEYSRFIFFFFIGSHFYLQRARIPLRADIAAIILVLLAASMLLPEVRHRAIALSLATPYLVMFFAFVPSGLIRAYNSVGDYSYGLYIYGAPVQHVVFAVGGSTMSLGEYFGWSLGIAGGLAVLSWHLLERRALRTALPRFGRRENKAIPEEVLPVMNDASRQRSGLNS